MSTDGRRKLKAVVLIAMLAGAEAEHIASLDEVSNLQASSAAGSVSVAAGIVPYPNIQMRGRLVAEEMQALMADPRLQEQAKFVAKHVEAAFDDPVFREHAKLVVKRMDALMASPTLQEQAKRLVKQMVAMMSDSRFQDQARYLGKKLKAIQNNPNSQQQARLFAEQISAMKTQSIVQEQAKLVAEHIKEFKTDSNIQEQVELLAKELKSAQANLNLQRQSKLIAEQIEVLKADPNFQEKATRIAGQMMAIFGKPNMLSLSAQAHARRLAVNYAAYSQNSVNIGRLLDNVVDQLYKQALRASPVFNKGLSKPAHSAISSFRISSLLLPFPLKGNNQPVKSMITRGLPERRTSQYLAKGKSETPLSRSASVDALSHLREERAALLRKSVLTSIVAPLAMLGLGVQAASASGLVEQTVAGDTSGFLQAYLLIFASEIGDKTFFIAGLLAAKYSKVISFTGSAGALAVMTIISVVIGQVAHSLDEGIGNPQGIAWDDVVAVVAFAYFGAKNLYDAYLLPEGDSSGIDEERKEAEEVVSEQDAREDLLRAILQTFGLVFAAEIGDRSFFSTIALSAAFNPVGVSAGAIAAHASATGVAVLGGDFISKYLSEKVIGYLGGTLFLVFAATTATGIF